MQYDEKRLTRIVATDCGTTTTKAILIEWVDGEYRQTICGEAPTTVEAPLNDVTKGVMPFMIAQFIVMFLLVLFPSIVMVPLNLLTK